MQSKVFSVGAVSLGAWLVMACASGAGAPAQAPVQAKAAPATQPVALTPAAEATDAPVKYAASDEVLESKADEDGPGATCTIAGCMSGQNPCGKAACMIPYGGGDPVCEYAPKLTGGCRCWPGDKRPCTLPGGLSGLKTCIAHPTALETYWTICS